MWHVFCGVFVLELHNNKFSVRSFFAFYFSFSCCQPIYDPLWYGMEIIVFSMSWSLTLSFSISLSPCSCYVRERKANETVNWNLFICCVCEPTQLSYYLLFEIVYHLIVNWNGCVFVRERLRLLHTRAYTLSTTWSTVCVFCCMSRTSARARAREENHDQSVIVVVVVPMILCTFN